MTDQRRSRAPLFAALAVAGAAIGATVVYMQGGANRNLSEADRACTGAVAAARPIAGLTAGDPTGLAALTGATRGLIVPALSLADGEGRPKTLEAWRGRWVLLNLWATWCVPCRKEMPTLDALQAALGGPDFEVVALNIDTRDPKKPRDFLTEIGVTRLAYYADPTAKAFRDLQAVGRAPGMPTTILIDPKGCEVAFLPGPADWGSERAVAVIRAAMAAK
jgi:thiol-disulfide isomerase/thioredoxin